MISLDPSTTALILIDLQNGIVSLPLAPYEGTVVVERCKPLAARFREAGALIVQVNVSFSKDFADAPPSNVDAAAHGPSPDQLEHWSTHVDGVLQPGDLLITKRQWGAFTGTGLDQQLRRRGIRTIVLAGIATNIGVESTARHAWELGYDLITVEDCCSTFTEDMHKNSFSVIFPRISRVRQASDLTFG